jgi:hypothetical protein
MSINPLARTMITQFTANPGFALVRPGYRTGDPNWNMPSTLSPEGPLLAQSTPRQATAKGETSEKEW